MFKKIDIQYYQDSVAEEICVETRSGHVTGTKNKNTQRKPEGICQQYLCSVSLRMNEVPTHWRKGNVPNFEKRGKKDEEIQISQNDKDNYEDSRLDHTEIWSSGKGYKAGDCEFQL